MKFLLNALVGLFVLFLLAAGMLWAAWHILVALPS